MTSNSFKEQTELILERLRIEDVIGEYINLKKIGRRFSAVCPFHMDKDPSLSVNSEKGFWHCFGCGAGGNLITFVMKIESMSFVEALRFLSAKAGVDFELDPEAAREFKRKGVLHNIVKEAAIFYHDKLFSPVGSEALNFLKNRGINESSIRRFGLGYAPSGKNNLTYRLSEKGFEESDISASGIVSEREDRTCMDLFRNRITIPILDYLGHFIAMAGRTLDDSQAKYINSPESRIFNKSSNLFGLNFTKIFISKSDTAFLVEGYFDLIALWQYGITNVVASMGTSFTQGQAYLLRKFASNVVIAYDSDSAGSLAAMRNIDIFQNAGIVPKIMTLDDGHDPDTFVRKFGKELLMKRAAKAKDAVDYHIARQISLNDLSAPQGKSAFIKELLPILKKMKDSVALAEYIKRISEESSVSEHLIRNMLKGSVQRVDPVLFNEEHKVVSNEERLLSVILQYPKFITKVSDTLSLPDINDEDIRKIYDILFFMPDKTELTAADFSGHVTDEGLLNKIMELFMSEKFHIPSEETASAMTDELLVKIKESKLKERFAYLKKDVLPALARGEIEHSDERFVEYQRLYQYFKGRK